jgi:hypothetical protein
MIMLLFLLTNILRPVLFPNSTVAFPVFVESMVHLRRAEQTGAFSRGMCTAYIEVTDFEPAMPL